MSRHIILVGIDDCAFKLVTSNSADGVNDIVAYAVGIIATRHSDKQMIGLDYLDFVDCKSVVQSN